MNFVHISLSISSPLSFPLQPGIGSVDIKVSVVRVECMKYEESMNCMKFSKCSSRNNLKRMSIRHFGGTIGFFLSKITNTHDSHLHASYMDIDTLALHIRWQDKVNVYHWHLIDKSNFGKHAVALYNIDKVTNMKGRKKKIKEHFFQVIEIMNETQ